MKRPTHSCLFKRDDSVIPLVEVLERVAQLHQVVLVSFRLSIPTLFK